MRVKSCCGHSLQVGSVYIGWVTCIVVAATTKAIVRNLFIGKTSLIGGFFIGYLIIHGVISGCLCHGSRKRKRVWIAPYVYMGFTYIFVDILILILGSIAAVQVRQYQDVIADEFIILVAIVTTLLAMHIYCWIVVYSFYKELSQEEYGHAVDESVDDVKVENI